MLNYVRVTHLGYVTALYYVSITQSTLGGTPKHFYIEEHRNEPFFSLLCCCCRMGGEQNEIYFCEDKSLSMPTLRMTSEAKVTHKFFSPFAAVSLCRVAGLAETFPSFPISGPFLPDVPGFQVPPDSIFPPQLRSSSRALPLHLHFDNSSLFSVSSLLLTCPNHSSLLLLITIAKFAVTKMCCA